MKLSLKVLAAGITALLILSSCVSAPENDTSETITQNETEPIKTKKIEEKTPEDPPEVAFAKKLQAKLENRDIQGALALFDTIPDAIASDKDMIFLHASLLLSSGDLTAAGEMGKNLENDYPDDIEILEMNALIAKESGNSADYKNYSNRILSLNPNNPTINIQKGQEFALNKKWKQAKQSYSRALTEEPDNEDALFGFGLMNYYLMQDSDAVNSFQKILENNPHNSMALAYMGKLSAENENFKGAISYIEEAIKYDPSNYDFFMDYGTYLHQLNRNSEAITQWEKARNMEPDYFLAYAYLAGINDELNNYDAALENYRKVIETNPDYFYAFESAGVLEWHAQNWAAARDDFYKAFVADGQKNWSYALMIAATYLKEGNQFKAKEFLAPVLKKTDKESLEYQMIKFYYDSYSKNAANTLVLKIAKEESSTKRGKLNFYFALYNEIYNSTEVAADYYGKVASMQAPMFFEYRIAEWALGL